MLRDHPATDHNDIARITRAQRLDQLGGQCFMACRLAGNAHNMHVIVDGVLCGLFRGLKQRAHIHIKPDIGKGRCNHLCPAVVAILAHFHNQHARAAALVFGELLDRALNGGKAFVALVSGTINARQGFHLGAVAAKLFFHSHADFPHRGACACGINRCFQQVATLGRAAGDLGQGRLAGRLVAAGAHFFQPRNLAFAHFLVVDFQNVDRVFFVFAIFVHAHDHLVAAVDHRLAGGGRFLDAQLGHAAGNRLGHAAHFLDLLHQGPGFFDQLVGQAFHVIRACQRVYHLGNAGFFLQNQLRIAGNACRKFGGQGNGLVQRVGVQRLGAAQNRAQRLVGGAHHVVVRVLLLQRHARGLAMGAQHFRALVLRAKFGHHPVPQGAGRAQFGDFHKEIHTDRKKERQPPREFINIHTRLNGRAHIFAPIGQGIGQLLHQVGAGLLHVIARDRDRVEFRHLVRGIFDDIGNDPHRGFGRVNIGVTHHEFFQNVILNGARQQRFIVALFFAHHDEIGQNRDHRAIHGHRNRNLVQRDAVEENFHIFHAVDRHASLAHIAHHTGVIAVIAAMGGQIEGHRYTLLARRQRLAVKGV